ncbi:MAG: GGDEF domain-containing protein [Oscillospiraceae bacterium]
MNFSYYIFSSNDIKATIQNQSIHILLLIVLAIAVYITIFHLLQKDMMQKQLKRDKIHFEQMAFKDSLTGVGNRNGYEELAKVVETMEDKQKICVGAFDINDLKKVNDTMGHDMGDKYICDCCQIICRAHKSSAVFRMGGDEFVVVSKYSSDTYINDSINSIMALTNEYNNRNSPYKISIAYGYERFHIEKYPTLNDVKNEADRLMYENKKIMKNKKAQSI